MMAGGRTAKFVVARQRKTGMLALLANNVYDGRKSEFEIVSSHRTKEVALRALSNERNKS